MTIVSLISSTLNSSAVVEAKNLLTRCEAGEVTGFTAIEEHPGGTYALVGSSTSSRTQTAGMLLDAAIRRLGDE